MRAGPQVLLEAAAEAARVAGEAALRLFGSGVGTEIKRDGSPVTAADREAERAARAWIERRFPDDGIVGEEFGETRPLARRRWYLDPVDGTASFVHGVPLWGTLVGVTESEPPAAEPHGRANRSVSPGERVIAGAACFPALGERLSAARGLGCWWNGARCRVSAVSELSAATVLTTDERFAGDRAQSRGWRRLAARACLARSWGDGYGYLLVATGRAELMSDGRLCAWDAVPFLPIIEEAGGVFTDWACRATPFGGSAIATNAGIASAARRLIAGEPAAAGEARRDPTAGPPPARQGEER